MRKPTALSDAERIQLFLAKVCDMDGIAHWTIKDHFRHEGFLIAGLVNGDIRSLGTKGRDKLSRMLIVTEKVYVALLADPQSDFRVAFNNAIADTWFMAR